MSESIVRYDVQSLIDQWLEAEEKGDRFPVDFDIAWSIAGYSRKDSAKRKLPKSAQGKLYHISVVNSGGRPKEVIKLSCDGLKHLSLMAETPEGEEIRQYFIEAEKNWKLVQKIDPGFAEQVELMQLKIELAKIEAQKETAIASAKNADLALMNLRNTIVTTCPEPIQQKILGFKVVEKVEYRDRVIAAGQMINDGNGLTKTELCHRYKILTRNGKPDFRRLNLMLENLGMDPTSDSDAWQMSAAIQESYQFKRQYLRQLDDMVIRGDRQLFLGE